MGTAADVENGKSSPPSSGCWSYRTGLEKALFKGLFVITAVAVVLAVLTANHYMYPVKPSPECPTLPTSKVTEAQHKSSVTKEGGTTEKKTTEEGKTTEKEKTTEKKTTEEGKTTEKEKTTEKKTTEEGKTTEKEKTTEKKTTEEGKTTEKEKTTEKKTTEEEKTTEKEKPTTEEGGEEKICKSKECKEQAEEIMGAMDTKVDPCEDFYEYACGNWIKNNPIPEDRSHYSTFSKLNEEITEKLIKSFTEKEEDKEEKEPEALKKARKLFKSCMDEETIEKKESKPLVEVLDKLGGWPVLEEEWEEKKFNLEELIVKINMVDHDALWERYVSADDKKSNKNVIQIEQARLGLRSRDYYLEEKYAKILEAYKTFATEIAEKLGAKEPEKEIEEMIEFEKELAKITVPEDERRNTMKMYHARKLENLEKEMTEEIDFRVYLEKLFKQVDIDLEKDTEIVVHGEKYYEELGKLVKETEKKTLANYVIWQVVHTSVYFLANKEFEEIIKKYTEVKSGISEKPSREHTCVSSVSRRFRFAVGRMFVNEYFDVKSKKVAKEMIEGLTKAFKSMLEDEEWMDKKTSELAVEKVDKMNTLIGYPDYILDDEELNKQYKEHKVDEEEYFLNVVEYWTLGVEENMKKLEHEVDRTEWGMAPQIVNAYHSSNKNLICIPAGILQSPFYNKQSMRAINYGGIGVVIGHEITHGFDDHGRRFDAEGNLNQWWPEEVIKKFEKKAECIVEQYNKYFIKEVELHVNGRNTQGENIADNGGLKESFLAYRKYIEEEGEEEKTLPDLKLTPNQLFFIGYAQVWCGNYRKASIIDHIKNDPHSPGRFRVIGAISNSEDFAKAYKCKADSPMNPEKKCKVW